MPFRAVLSGCFFWLHCYAVASFDYPGLKLAPVFLVRWMSLLFVPIGVGVIDQLDLLANSLGALLLTSILGTVIIMAVAGWLFQWLERTQR